MKKIQINTPPNLTPYIQKSITQMKQFPLTGSVDLTEEVLTINPFDLSGLFASFTLNMENELFFFRFRKEVISRLQEKQNRCRSDKNINEYQHIIDHIQSIPIGSNSSVQHLKSKMRTQPIELIP